MNNLTIHLYSHSFVVSGFSRDMQRIIIEYSKQFVLYEKVRKWTGEIDTIAKCVFSTATSNKSEFRFHRNAYNDFLRFVGVYGYSSDMFTIIEAPPMIPQKVEIGILPTATPRENQLPIIDFITKDYPTKLVILQMGGGKTFSSLYSIALLKERFVISIRPMYIERWVKALTDDKEKILDLQKEDLRVVRGGAELIKLIKDAKEDNLKAKIIIISNKTLYLFYNHYKQTSGDTSLYGIHPIDFYPLLKANRLIDEVHQDFHLNFIQDLYTHTKTVVDLSATMATESPFIKKMYGWRFPLQYRYEDTNYDKYTAAKALLYRIKDPGKIRFSSKGRSSYSHNEFEKSIRKDRKLQEKYLELIDEALDNLYFTEDLQKGQKAVVYAGLVEMCQSIVDHLREKHPNLVINKYTSGDSYQNLIESDISVTTIGSAGTAVDIPDIKLNLSTTAIGKRETNEQLMGRCRRSKRWPNMTPIFAYMVCEDIDKHINYHRKKIKFLEPYVLGIQTLYMDRSL